MEAAAQDVVQNLVGFFHGGRFVFNNRIHEFSEGIQRKFFVPLEIRFDKIGGIYEKTLDLGFGTVGGVIMNQLHFRQQLVRVLKLLIRSLKLGLATHEFDLGIGQLSRSETQKALGIRQVFQALFILGKAVGIVRLGLLQLPLAVRQLLFAVLYLLFGVLQLPLAVLNLFFGVLQLLFAVLYLLFGVLELLLAVLYLLFAVLELLLAVLYLFLGVLELLLAVCNLSFGVLKLLLAVRQLRLGFLQFFLAVLNLLFGFLQFFLSVVNLFFGVLKLLLAV